jgi:phosphatidylserine decarboxylase
MTSLQSDQFGRMLIIEVGAVTVGSIQQRFEPGISVAKGDHKGYFELGGSTVVLLFQPGRIQFDDDILNNSHRQIETSVRMGERIGIALRSLK